MVLWLTLRPAPAQSATVAALRWYCVACGAEGIADLLLNVLLFLPLGVAARALGWPARRTVLALGCISGAIELTQGNLLPGRAGSLGDVIANSCGAIIGWIAFPLVCALARPSERFARRGTWLVVAAMCATWLATGAGLRPALERTRSWIGQLRPSSQYTEPFAGTVSDVTVNGATVRDGVVNPPIGTGDSLEVTLHVVRDDMRHPLHTAVLARIKDSDDNLEAHVSQVGEDLVLESRLRGSHWRLHTPRWRFDSALAIPLHSAWRFSWRWEPGAIVLTSWPDDKSQPVREDRLTISVASGWAFIHPFVSVVGRSQGFWTACWLAGWFGLLGWLAGSVRGPTRWLAGIAAVGGLAAIGSAMALPVSMLELVIAAASYVVLLLAGARHTS